MPISLLKIRDHMGGNWKPPRCHTAAHITPDKQRPTAHQIDSTTQRVFTNLDINLIAGKPTGPGGTTLHQSTYPEGQQLQHQQLELVKQ